MSDEKKPTDEPVPLEHVVRVFRATPSGTRQALSISRPFPTPEAAENFYTRTVSVHEMKANRGQALAYVVVLGTVDARKWKKGREFTELKSHLCRHASHGRED